MHFKNHSGGYGLIAITLHWLMALLIVGLFALGLWMTELTYYDAWYREAPALHKSIGVMVIVLWLGRLLWRWANPRPQVLASHARWERILAMLVHWVMYLLVFLIGVSGYMISTADGRAIDVFQWFSIPAYPTSIENQEDIAGEVHFYLACTLIALAAAHGVAAIKHHLFDKDETLRRMLNPNLTPNSK